MKKAINNIFNVCFFIVSIMIFEVAFSQMILQSFFAGLMIIPVAALFLYIYIKKTDLIEKINYKAAWWILRIISIAFMMKLAFSLEVNFTWDWGGLINSSYNYIKTAKVDKLYYYARYPNNQFWLLCMVSLFKIIKLFVGNADIIVFKRVSMAVSVVIIQIAIEFIYRAAGVIFSAKKAFFAGIITLFCAPLYLYSGFLYTDTPCVLTASIMLFLYFKIQKSKSTKSKIVFYILLGITGAFSYLIKLTSVIVFVAILIGMIFNKISFKQFMCFFLVSIVTLGVTVKAVSTVTKPICKEKFGITEELEAKNEFPPTHWVMMGLGYGGYLQEDVNYTASFDTYRKKEEANIKEIKKRVKDYGFFGFLNHTFSKKVIRTFGDCTLAGSYYAGRESVYNKGIFTRLLTWHGDLYPISLIYFWIYYIFITLGILFSAIESFKKKRTEENQTLLAGRIALFGILNFMLIWECNSRYILVFVPVLILLATDGLSYLVKTFNNYLNLKKELR